jgi:serine/threonine protein kinase
VKLIAVKDEDAPAPRVATHTRSVSDSADGTPSGSGAGTPVRGVASVVATPSGSPLQRPRSSTIFASGRQEPSQPSPVESARLILVLEHAPLGTLDRIIRTSPGLVGEQLWGRWAREASEALEWVHSRGVVHADVKPSNLLVSNDQPHTLTCSSRPTYTSA